jgi:hypothetical protein
MQTRMWRVLWLSLKYCLIGSYIRSWERPGDLPRVIEMLCLFASGAQRNEREDTAIYITSGRSPGLSQQRMQVPISSVNQQLSLSQTPRDAHHLSVTNLHTLSDQYHWALWNTHHIKLNFVTPTNKLSSFLLIFELFSLIFYWKYTILLHETPHTWNMTWHIFWRHWRMTSKVRQGHLEIRKNENKRHKYIFNTIGICIWK